MAKQDLLCTMSLKPCRPSKESKQSAGIFAERSLKRNTHLGKWPQITYPCIIGLEEALAFNASMAQNASLPWYALTEMLTFRELSQEGADLTFAVNFPEHRPRSLPRRIIVRTAYHHPISSATFPPSLQTKQP